MVTVVRQNNDEERADTSCEDVKRKHTWATVPYPIMCTCKLTMLLRNVVCSTSTCVIVNWLRSLIDPQKYM